MHIYMLRQHDWLVLHSLVLLFSSMFFSLSFLEHQMSFCSCELRLERRQHDTFWASRPQDGRWSSTSLHRNLLHNTCLCSYFVLRSCVRSKTKVVHGCAFSVRNIKNLSILMLHTMILACKCVSKRMLWHATLISHCYTNARIVRSVCSECESFFKWSLNIGHLPGCVRNISLGNLASNDITEHFEAASEPVKCLCAWTCSMSSPNSLLAVKLCCIFYLDISRRPEDLRLEH